MARSSRTNKSRPLLLAAMSVAFTAALSGHRFDEYLQAARIAVELNHVTLDLNLTPGIAVADGVIRAIDGDGDGVLSAAEQQAYANRILGAIALHVDDAPASRLTVAAATFPDAAALRQGDAAITIRSEVVVPVLAAGRHRIFFRNGNATTGGVYLANALVPESDAIAVVGQRRDASQSELTIDVIIRGTPASSIWVGLGGVLVLGVLLTWRARTSARPDRVTAW